jgi:hypothetical protein
MAICADSSPLELSGLDFLVGVAQVWDVRRIHTFMQWRIIIRFSLDYDENSAVRNQVEQILDVAGITRTATGTWESAAAAPAIISKQLAQVMGILQNPQQIAGVQHYTHLDHIWIYIDQQPATPTAT